MGNQSKIEVIHDELWYRKGTQRTPMDRIFKFAWLGSQIIASGLPTSPKEETLEEQEATAKEAKRKLMMLIFENSGVLITGSGNISSAKNGGTQKGDTITINRTLKMANCTFNIGAVIEDKDYSTQLHKYQLKQWNIRVPKLSRITDEDFTRAIKASNNADEINGNAPLRESLKHAFKGVHRKNNPKASQALGTEPTKVDLDEARNLF